MRTRILIALTFALLVHAGGDARTPRPYMFTTLDVPDTAESGAYGINDKGEIVGYFLDGRARYHGFIYVDGTFSTLDAPLAYDAFGNGTFAAS